MKDLIRRVINETVKDGKVICDNCGWSWDIADGGDDTYSCHKCGHDNTPKSQSNLDRLMGQFETQFPNELKSKVPIIGNFVYNYIKNNNINIKFLNSCTTGFAGVRTRDQVIICAPSQMTTIGDFLYTVFHEIRHEHQIRDMKMINPLTDFDLEDFENLAGQYWEMELDADKFAKEMVAKIVIKLEIPIEIARKLFSLSPYIDNYPSMSKMIRGHLSQIVNGIKQMKKSGAEYEDIQDHPMVKRYIDKLEDFI
jgi:ribosomal protein S27AE